MSLRGDGSTRRRVNDSKNISGPPRKYDYRQIRLMYRSRPKPRQIDIAAQLNCSVLTVQRALKKDSHGQYLYADDIVLYNGENLLPTGS